MSVLFLFVNLQSQDIKSLSISTELPLGDVKMVSVDGKELSMNALKKENGLLVMFSCNTCPWVIKNQTRIIEISGYAAKNNLGVVIINSNESQRDDVDSFDEMKKYSKSQKYKWPYVIDKDSKVANAFGATKTPEIFLFNSDGILVYKGAIDDNPGDVENVKREHLKEAIKETVKGKGVSVKESRSMGCSIKRS